MTAILGASRLTRDQMVRWWAANAPAQPRTSCPIVELVGYYLTEGAAVGVAGDIAFMQAIHED